MCIRDSWRQWPTKTANVSGLRKGSVVMTVESDRPSEFQRWPTTSMRSVEGSGARSRICDGACSR